MRNTKPGQINFTFGKGSEQEIAADSDPRAVRDMRDLCIRWLDARAAEDAFTAEQIRASIDQLVIRP